MFIVLLPVGISTFFVYIEATSHVTGIGEAWTLALLRIDRGGFLTMLASSSDKNDDGEEI